MVTEPAKWVGPLGKAGASLFTFHIESDMPEGGPKALIQMIRDAGMKVGIVVKPKTPIEEVFPYLMDIDHVLIMTVEPGFSGQKFMVDMMPKVKAVREKSPNMNIQVDGGLSPTTIGPASEAGANVIVAASAIFGSDDRKGVIDALRAGVEKQITVWGGTKRDSISENDRLGGRPRLICLSAPDNQLAQTNDTLQEYQQNSFSVKSYPQCL